jgi:hypothetical protein
MSQMRDNADIEYLQHWEKNMPAKKTTTKKSPAKKEATRKTATTKASGPKLVRMAKRPQMESFRLARPQSPFLTIAITRQTLYWAIIAAAVLGLGMWIIYLQNQVNQIYDAIDASSADNNLVIPHKKASVDK